jgi:hypothetical protein
MTRVLEYDTRGRLPCFSPNGKYLPFIVETAASPSSTEHSLRFLMTESLKSPTTEADAGLAEPKVLDFVSAEGGATLSFEFARNDSAIAYLKGPPAAQELRVAMATETGLAVPVAVAQQGENMEIAFSAAGGFLAYVTGAPTQRRVYVAPIAAGSAPSGERLNHAEPLTAVTDILWQPPRTH